MITARIQAPEWFLHPEERLLFIFTGGTDAYLHAAGLVGEKDSPSSVTLDSAVITVTGTVDGRSDQNMLYLNTPQGVMELKLDTVKNLNNCKVFNQRKKYYCKLFTWFRCLSACDGYYRGLIRRFPIYKG